MKNFYIVILLCIVGVAGGYYYFNNIKMKSVQSFSIEKGIAASSDDTTPGSATHAWVGDVLTITVISEIQSCGDTVWDKGYVINGDTLKVVAKGRGHAMNCPTIPAKFNFSINGIEKKEYRFISEIHEDLK